MANKWQLQQAKDRLSEVVDCAIHDGPQTVTRHGKEVVVIVAKPEFDRRRRRKSNGALVAFLRSLSFARGKGVRFERSTDVERNVDL